MKIEKRDVLECPVCGEENMHHTAIKIFGRSEDGKTVYTEISADAKDPKQTPWVDNFPENPSSRRDAVAIVFRCEHHNLDITLNISQNKGSTFLEWTFAT